jgi:hypothetical protein
MVKLGLANSRIKDFYDLVILARMFEFDGELVVLAIRAMFQRRGTALPNGLPVALTSSFVGDALKNTQWTAFVRESGASSAGDLAGAAAAILEFAEAPLRAAASAASLSALVAWWPMEVISVPSQGESSCEVAASGVRWRRGTNPCAPNPSVLAAAAGSSRCPLAGRGLTAYEGCKHLILF